jgi:hypothetical protein
MIFSTQASSSFLKLTATEMDKIKKTLQAQGKKDISEAIGMTENKDAPSQVPRVTIVDGNHIVGT